MLTLIQISGTALLIAFILYTIAFFLFVIAQIGKNWSDRVPAEHAARWGWRGFTTAAVGLAAQLTYFVTRWISSGFIPVSNMFEFMTFFSMMIVSAYLVLHVMYRSPIIGAFAMPVGIVMLAYAAVFPRDIQPLIPALQSYWLSIHVTTAAAGEAFFAMGFAAGLMYLIRTLPDGLGKAELWTRRGVEFSLFAILVVVGFIAAAMSFQGAGYQAEFIIVEQTVEMEEIVDQEGANGAAEYEEELPLQQRTITYTLPPLVQVYGSQLVSMKPFIGLEQPLFTAPQWMRGIDAGKKLNTLIWSIVSGLILYGLLRLLFRKPLAVAFKRVTNGIDPEDLDEISYRTIAIGYPIFALGALIFAMIWAHEAWGRFWDWDPKEVWALITFLFYTVYLHLRLSRGWIGRKSAWLAVLGFIVVMFTLVGVNLLLVSLHSYSGV